MLEIYLKQQGLQEKKQFLYEYENYTLEIKKDFNLEIKSMYKYEIDLYIEGNKYTIKPFETVKIKNLFKSYNTSTEYMDLGYIVNNILNITVKKKEWLCDCLNETVIYTIKVIKYL